jgi:hypothetical protein
VGKRREGWEKPKEGFCKLNVDEGATGAVIRDDSGSFIAWNNCGISSITDAALAEARALRDGLLLAGQVGCTKLIVTSDCMEVISTMLNGGNSIGAAAAIYEECTFLARGFSHVNFIHSYRESNLVAHVLASKAEGPYSVCWTGDPSAFIVELLTNDVSLFDKYFLRSEISVGNFVLA